MIKLLTAWQIRVCLEAKSIFRDVVANSELRSMFRQEGDGIEVVLCLSEAGHHFIVRHNVHLGGLEDFAGVCLDMLAVIGDMHAQVLGRPVAVRRP